MEGESRKSNWRSRLVLQEPHLVAASVGLERRVVAAAEVLLALVGRRLAQGARQTRGLGAVLALPREAPELSAKEREVSVKTLTFDRYRSGGLMLVPPRRHLQRVDGHAGPLLDLHGRVSRGRGALLVDAGNADGGDQTARHDAVIPRVHGDDDGCRRAHGLAW